MVPLGGGELGVVAGVGRGPVLALVQPDNLLRGLLYQRPTQKRLNLKFIRMKRVGIARSDLAADEHHAHPAPEHGRHAPQQRHHGPQHCPALTSHSAVTWFMGQHSDPAPHKSGFMAVEKIYESPRGNQGRCGIEL